MKFKIGDKVKLNLEEECIKIALKENFKNICKLKSIIGKIVKIKGSFIYVNFKIDYPYPFRKCQFILFKMNYWDKEQL